MTEVSVRLIERKNHPTQAFKNDLINRRAIRILLPIIEAETCLKRVFTKFFDACLKCMTSSDKNTLFFRFKL